jgi:hypothetical protein
MIRGTHAASRASCTWENITDIDWGRKQKTELIGDRRRVTN